MNILLTGAAGFIGFHISSSLLEKGHEVTGIDNLNNYYDVSLKKNRLNFLLKNKKFVFLNGDINNLKELKNKKFDVVLNFAAQAGVRLPKEQFHKYTHSNINGFRNICDYCIKNNIDKLIYASSSSVYGNQNSKLLSENLDLKPLSFYGKTKQFNENYMDQISSKYGISSIGLRFFSEYGEYGRPDMAYYLFTKNIIENNDIFLNNNGNMARDMTHIQDINRGVLSSISYLPNVKEKNEIVNLGNSSPIKTSFLLNFIEDRLKKKAKIIHKSTSNEIKQTYACLKKSTKLLKYRPEVTFEDGLNDFIDWLKSLQ